MVILSRFRGKIKRLSDSAKLLLSGTRRPLFLIEDRVFKDETIIKLLS